MTPRHATVTGGDTGPVYAGAGMNWSNTPKRPLGVPALPRRRLQAPAAVRVAQVTLVARIAIVLVMVLTAGLVAAPVAIDVPPAVHVLLPDGATWRAIAVWVVTGSIFEATLAMRVGQLRGGSLRAILLVESLVIAVAGLYAAAGVKVALLPLVCSITTVVLLRLDHVRHSFARAHADRTLLSRKIRSTVFEGYAAVEPELVERQIQGVGYRAGVDCAPVDPASHRSSS